MNNKLENYQKNYSTSQGLNALASTQLGYRTFSKYFSGKSCLELGCADGGGTKILLPHFDNVTVVDGSSLMLSRLSKNIQSKKLTVVHSLFENLNLKKKFDTIVASHVLEHVEIPELILETIRHHAHPKSRIIISVPNANSLHRQAGVLLRILNSVYDLGKSDKLIGHGRVFDQEKLRKIINGSGFRIVAEGGYFLKIFSYSQLEKIMANSGKMINAYGKLGERYPEIAAEIYAVCKI